VEDRRAPQLAEAHDIHLHQRYACARRNPEPPMQYPTAIAPWRSFTRTVEPTVYAHDTMLSRGIHAPRESLNQCNGYIPNTMRWGGGSIMDDPKAVLPMAVTAHRCLPEKLNENPWNMTPLPPTVGGPTRTYVPPTRHVPMNYQ